jgi:lipoprotein-anchoring transpeptidase ErfK/SrfK
MITRLITALLLVTSFTTFAHAQTEVPAAQVQNSTNMMDELDPFDPNIEQKLQEMDRQYEQETGKSAFLPNLGGTWASCRQSSCPIYIKVNKAVQRAYLYKNGWKVAEWLVSTGIPGRGTPNFEGHPNGRIYDAYTSTKYPEGDYNGLGNMPYAVFYNGGFAIHGTTPGSFRNLGKKASHGCVRMHPDNGYTFNRLVRQYGINNVWISIYE